jgi:maltose phosphorylase
MKDYIKHDEWLIIEDSFQPDLHQVSESIFSIGNGRFGQRANFEEDYSGESLQGNYVAGVYYPDKTRVGWWKNGYPEYFAKVLNAANWIGIKIEIDGESLDLAQCEVSDFRRVLDMKEGCLHRSFEAKMTSGKVVRVNATRFCSIADDEIGAIDYQLTPVNFSAPITITPYVDGDVVNQDSNYDEKFWTEVAKDVELNSGYVVAETRKTAFQVCTGMKFDLQKNGEKIEFNSYRLQELNYVGCGVDLEVNEGDTVTVQKYAAVISSMNYAKDQLISACAKALDRAYDKGFEQLKSDHVRQWGLKWEEADIVIEGDVAAQQGIRFNIFHMYQTYTGEDERLNIGPKGFTGEKYGGSTYWDTEAYCLPVLPGSTADSGM